VIDDAPAVPPADTPAVGRPQTLDLDARSVVLVVTAAFLLTILLALLRETRVVLTWMVIGTLLALALDPVVAGIERRLGVRRSIALGIVIAALVGAANLVVVAVAPAATREAAKFGADLPRVVGRLGELPIVGPRLTRADAPAKVTDWLQSLPARLSSDPKPIEALTRAALGGALAAFMTILVAVVLLLDGRRLLQQTRRLVPAQHQARFERVADITYRTVGRYFAGSLFISMLVGICMLVAGLALRVPLIPVVAAWAAVTNLIPQIGGFLGGSAFVLLGLTRSPGTAVACLVYFLIWQQIENHVLQPTIIGDAVDLSPPATMLAALVGGATASVPGALVAVPLLGVAKQVYFELRSPGRPPRRRRRRGPVSQAVRRRFIHDAARRQTPDR
jgi:predicted PurR-regulated permease PerM